MSPLQGSFFTCSQPRAQARCYSLSPLRGSEFDFYLNIPRLSISSQSLRGALLLAESKIGNGIGRWSRQRPLDAELFSQRPAVAAT